MGRGKGKTLPTLDSETATVHHYDETRSCILSVSCCKLRRGQVEVTTKTEEKWKVGFAFVPADRFHTAAAMPATIRPLQHLNWLGREKKLSLPYAVDMIPSR